jgi:UDP-N-acetylmuramate dehydrogenase
MDLRSFVEKINSEHPFIGDIKFDEPMSSHTSFKTGGNADLLVRPAKQIFPTWSAAMLKAAKAEAIPVFILGGGANLLVSDKGIRGIVLDTGAWDNPSLELFEKNIKPRSTTECHGGGEGGLLVKVLSGTSVDSLTQKLADQGLSGLEFLAGMPGSVGGAVWMNARCYEKSVSAVLAETQILDENFQTVTVPFCEKDFSYKKSPFQSRNVLILSAVFRIIPRDTPDIQKEMSQHKQDREEKGHYRFPSAGSVFKNNQAFGAPSGKIIADLGLRGLSREAAQVAPWHGNFIINTGGASSSDIRFLIEEIASRVKQETGFDLEPEIIFAGEW